MTNITPDAPACHACGTLLALRDPIDDETGDANCPECGEPISHATMYQLIRDVDGATVKNVYLAGPGENEG